MNIYIYITFNFKSFREKPRLRLRAPSVPVLAWLEHIAHRSFMCRLHDGVGDYTRWNGTARNSC